MLWKYTDKEIRMALYKMFGEDWIDYYRPSGLYIFVVMSDGSSKTIYDNKIEEALYK